MRVYAPHQLSAIERRLYNALWYLAFACADDDVHIIGIVDCCCCGISIGFQLPNVNRSTAAAAAVFLLALWLVLVLAGARGCV